jgi:hypothetical protein
MKVMVLVKGDANYEAGAIPETKLLAEMGKFNEELVKAGVMLAGEGLAPSSQGARVKFANGKTTVIDGPFAESKELVAGFWVWQVRSMDEAIAWLKRAPFDATEVELQTGAEVDGEVVVFVLTRVAVARGRQGRVGDELFLVTLPAEAHTDVRPPLGVGVTEVVARVGRQAVLAPPQVRVRGLVRVLVVQLHFDGPVRIQELAEAERAEDRVFGVTIRVLEVDARAASDVPTVVEGLRGGRLGDAEATEQRDAEEFLVHVQLLDQGKET